MWQCEKIFFCIATLLQSAEMYPEGFSYQYTGISAQILPPHNLSIINHSKTWKNMQPLGILSNRWPSAFDHRATWYVTVSPRKFVVYVTVCLKNLDVTNQLEKLWRNKIRCYEISLVYDRKQLNCHSSSNKRQAHEICHGS